MSLSTFFESPRRSRSVMLLHSRIAVSVTAITLLILSALCLLTVAPVCAGGWNVASQSNGEFDATYYNSDGTSSTVPTPWPNPWRGQFPDPSYTYAPSGSYASSGDITATLTWTPSSPTDLPPADQQTSLSVLEDASATAQWHGPGAYPPDCVRVVSDGLTDPGVVNYDTPEADTLVSRGKHLIQVGVTRGADGVYRAVLPPRHLAASGTKGSGSWLTTVPIAYTAQPDNRRVEIARGGGKPAFIGNDGKRHGEWTEPGGTMHGETTYSFLYGSQSGNPAPKLSSNWVYFASALYGRWTKRIVYDSSGQISGYSPDVAWSWSPAESDDTINSAKCQMPQSGITYYDNGSSSGSAAGPIDYPVTYTATDNGDGATATVSYILSVHDQWENLRLDPTHPYDPVDINDLVKVAGSNYPAQINPDYEHDAPVGPLSVGATVGFQFSAQLNGTFKISDFFTLGGNFTATGSASVTANQSITGPPIPARCYIQLRYEIHYHRNHWLTDHYAPDGFDQTYEEDIDDQKDAVSSIYWGHPIELAGSGLDGA